MRSNPKGTEASSNARSRSEPLRAANLLEASRGVQQAFWVQHNRRPRRRGPLPLTETLGEVLQEGGGIGRGHIGRVSNLMQAVLPAEMVEEVEVGALHRGTLTLHTRSGATAFECARVYADLLLQACREAAPELRVRRVRVSAGHA